MPPISGTRVASRPHHTSRPFARFRAAKYTAGPIVTRETSRPKSTATEMAPASCASGEIGPDWRRVPKTSNGVRRVVSAGGSRPVRWRARL